MKRGGSPVAILVALSLTLAGCPAAPNANTSDSEMRPGTVVRHAGSGKRKFIFVSRPGEDDDRIRVKTHVFRVCNDGDAWPDCREATS